jgi:glycosyltransferase involved in cell wall biosynthesis
MRIAQIAPLQTATPPHAYGGTERVISNLTESLVQLGHDVTLYATGDSQTSARLVPGVTQGVNFDPEIDINAYHIGMLKSVYEHADEFDIIHSHLDYLTLPFVGTATTPTVVTLHGRSDTPEFTNAYQAYADAGANFVAISQSQRRSQPNLNWIATIHHGVDIQSFTFYPKAENYLCFVGRIAPDKRPERAIEIAKRVGLPLKIAAKIGPQDRDFFASKVEPLLDSSIEFLGQLDENKKRDLIGHALALLLPIDWPEPFGMVFIEALASGTPVLTCPLGAAPEVLTDGLTGYLRRTVDELVEAVYELPSISRAGCRRYAAERFDMRRMTMRYLNVYSRLLGGGALFPQSFPARDDLPDTTLRIKNSAGSSVAGGMAPLETIDGVSGEAV